MAFEEWLALGGNEIINNARTVGYAESANCPMGWFKGDVCPTLAAATFAMVVPREAEAEEDVYRNAAIERAPWYDPVLPDVSRRFYGAFGLSVQGIESSTREATVTQGLSDGGVIGRVRKAPRNIRVRALLAAEGQDALEYGVAWLNAALDPNACGQHGDACGTADLAFFSTCPPARRLVPLYSEWTLAFENLLTNPSFETATGTPVMVRKNLMLSPSFETQDTNPGPYGVGTIEVRQNYILNPKMQTTTGWSTTPSDYTLTPSADGLIVDVLTESADNPMIFPTALIAKSNGRYSSAYEVTVPEGYPPMTVRLTTFSYGENLQLNASGERLILPGQTVRVEAEAGQYAGSASTGLSAILNAVDAPLGGRVIVRNAVLEYGYHAGAYFDGDTEPEDPALTAIWTGAVDASTSVVYGPKAMYVSSSVAWPQYMTQDGPTRGSWLLRGFARHTGQGQFFMGSASAVAHRRYTIVFKVRPHGKDASIHPLVARRSGPVMTVPADVWTEVRFTATASENVSSSWHGFYWNSESGDVIDVDEVMVTEGEYAGPYFDGDTPPTLDAETTYSWEGTAHRSRSVESGIGIEGASGGTTGAHLVQSSAWSSDRTFSGRVFRSEVGDQYQSLDLADRLPSGVDATVLFTTRVETPITLGGPIALTDGVNLAEIVAAGTVLDGEQTWIATVPIPPEWAATKSLMLRGGSRIGDDIWYDSMLVVEGSYASPYFDGFSLDSEFRDFEWTGTPDASTSTVLTRAIVGDQPEPPETFLEEVNKVRRFLHDVAAVNGPLVQQELKSGPHWAYIVEFTLAAGNPYVFGVLRKLELPPRLPVVVSDIPYNLVPYPSAELTSGTVVVATNYSTNPSVEVNDVGWTKDQVVVVPADVTGGRSTALAAHGSASYRTHFVASNAGASGEIWVDHTSGPFPSTGSRSRMSVNLWASASVAAGTAVISDIHMSAIWFNSANAVLREDEIGTEPPAGGSMGLDGFNPPAGSVKVVLRARARLASWSAGAIVDLFADAATISVP